MSFMVHLLGKTRIFFKLSKIYNSQSPVKADEVKQSHTLNTPLFVVTPLVLSNLADLGL